MATGLSEALAHVLAEYRNACEQPFSRHPLAAFLRNDLTKALAAIVGHPERYRCRASAGQGTWAKVPWAAVLDLLVTDSAQSGYYPVFLFREDMSGVYLSLNQGVSEIVEAKYKSGAGEALRTKAADMRLQVGGPPATFPDAMINLRLSPPPGLARYYEDGNVFATLYEAGALPTDEELRADLTHMLGLYDALSYNETIPSGNGGTEADEEGTRYLEDLRRFRHHKRIERNARLVKAVKQCQGARCKVCAMAFSEVYGSLGTGYIEAHHLTPLAQLKGRVLKLDPMKDFVVLCSNCHAMVHRTDDPSDVDGFVKHHYRGALKGSPWT